MSIATVPPLAQPNEFIHEARAAAFFPDVRDDLHALKYEGKAKTAESLARMLWREYRVSGWTPHTITAVPMHPEKLKKRGFNQAELIARVVAAHVGVTYHELLEKVRLTKSQTKQGRYRRVENASGAYKLHLVVQQYSDGTKYLAAPIRLPGQTVLIIDDVWTTGATLTECARVLRDGGAGKVLALTVARGKMT